MNKNFAGDITCLATLIAVELSKDKTPEEIFEIKALLNQIASTMTTISLFKSKK